MTKNLDSWEPTTKDLIEFNFELDNTSDSFWNLSKVSEIETKRKLIAIGVHPKFISPTIEARTWWGRVKQRWSEAWRVMTCRHEYEPIGKETWCLKCDHQKVW